MQYLLRTLSESERERFEERYFSDDTEFEELEIAEDELIDRYVRGELSQSDKEGFEKTLAGSPRLMERVQFAKVLAKNLPVVESLETPDRILDNVGWWNKFFGVSRESRLALSFGVLLTLLGVGALLTSWLQFREGSRQLSAQQAELAERQRELEKREAALKAQADELAKRGQQLPAETPDPSPDPQETAPRPTFAFLTLSPGTTRSTGGSSNNQIRQGISEVRITLLLRDTDYPSYRATVVRDDREVFSKSDLRPRVTKNRAHLILSIPTKQLPLGDYIVTVYGGPPGAANESVAEYVFHIIK